MNDKERLAELIKRIKNLTGQSQEDISVTAGYKPKSLTQLLSNKEGHAAVIKKIENAYRETLKVNQPARQGIQPDPPADIKDRYINLLEKQADMNTNLNSLRSELLDQLGANRMLLQVLYTSLVEGKGADLAQEAQKQEKKVDGNSKEDNPKDGTYSHIPKKDR